MDTIVNVSNSQVSVNVTNDIVSVVLNVTNTSIPLNIYYGISEEQALALLVKENIDGLKETDDPTFSDIDIPSLKSDASEGDIPADDYNWFKSVYATLVDKSVKSWIAGLVNQVKSLATRVGLLEDKYILKYVVPVNTSTINLTTDRYGNAFNFGEGESLLLIVEIPAWVQVTGLQTQLLFRFNEITSTIYNVASTVNSIVLSSLSSSRYSEYLLAYINCYDGEVIGTFDAQYSTTGTDLAASSRQFYTNGLNDTLKSINILVSGSTSLIPAGTIIIIKKL